MGGDGFSCRQMQAFLSVFRRKLAPTTRIFRRNPADGDKILSKHCPDPPYSDGLIWLAIPSKNHFSDGKSYFFCQNVRRKN